MENKIRTFRDLKVWQKGIELVREVYGKTKVFPKEEQYGLSSQMRRAAVSIPSNIAEGLRRRYDKEQRQFLNITIGSCAELETQIVIAKELKYITELDEQKLAELLDHICRMAVNLYRKI